MLGSLTKTDIEKGSLPLQEILSDSVFYPACGLDGELIRLYNHLYKPDVPSYVYCDWGVQKEDFLNALPAITGYQVFAQRELSKKDLCPNGWKPSAPASIDPARYAQMKQMIASDPYSFWVIFEREEAYDDAHGPSRFSLLYVCGEASATYQALYASNNTHANTIALIRPGTGFGGNFERFYDDSSGLFEVISGNPHGSPRLIISDQKLSWAGYTLASEHNISRDDDPVARYRFSYQLSLPLQP
jgi:hypothetical protein